MHHRRLRPTRCAGAVATVLLASALGLAAAPEASCADKAPTSTIAAVTIDLGSVNAGELPCRDIDLANTTPDVMQIRKVRSSCACVHVLSYPGEIAAGDTGALKFRLVADVPGLVKYDLFIETSDHQKPLRRYRITADVAPLPLMIPGPKREIDADLYARAVRHRDASLYINAESLSDLLSAGSRETVVVDVRRERDFQLFHIQGAINIKPHALKAQKFLQDNKVVIVDRGYGSEQLEKSCRAMRENGFASVSILNGGLNAWHSQGYPMVGLYSSWDADSLTKVSPAEFFSARKFDDWLAVDVSGDAECSFNVPECITVPCDRGPAECGAAIRNLVNERHGYTRVVILNADGSNYGEMKDALTGLQNASLFFLEDGAQGFAEHLRTLSAIRDPQKRKVGEPGTRGRSVLRRCRGCS